MKYTIRAIKNDTEIYEDELLMTNMVNSILQAPANHQLMPLSNNVTGGCLLFTDKIEKKAENVDVFGAKFLAGATYNSGSWAFSGVSGHVSSVCFSYASTAQNYGSEELTDTSIRNASDIMPFMGTTECCCWVDKDYFTTLIFGGLHTGDIVFNKYKPGLPYFGLDGWHNTILDKNTSELFFTYSIPAGEINTVWNAQNCGYSPESPNLFAQDKSVKYYGQFNGYSATQSKDKVYFINFFKYNIFNSDDYTYNNAQYTFANTVTVPTHSFVEILVWDKAQMNYKKYRFDDFDGDNSTTIPAGTYSSLTMKDEGDIVRMQAAAANDNKLYVICKTDYDTDNFKIYSFDVSDLENGTSFEFVADYSYSIIHNINRKNQVYRSSWNSVNDEILALGVQDGVCNYTGIFKGGMSAIANFDFDLKPTDTLTIQVGEFEHIHKFVEDEDSYVAPTMTEKGKKRDQVCELCGERILGEEIRELGGHSIKDETMAGTNALGYFSYYDIRDGKDKLINAAAGVTWYKETYLPEVYVGCNVHEEVEGRYTYVWGEYPEFEE